MILFQASEDIWIDAPPERVFGIVANIARHPELAGSGEVLRVRLLTAGPVGTGARFEADEDIAVMGRRLRFVSTSEVTAFEPARRLAWRSMPPDSMRPRMRRIEWTFELAPSGGGTRVAHRVVIEPEGGTAAFLFKPMYAWARGSAVRRGMRRTLANLRRTAEGAASAAA